VKTISLKKVSAVAVASLGFGLLSVVPANAAEANITTVKATAITLASAATNTNVVGSTVAINLGTAVNAGVTLIVTNTIRYTAFLSTTPAGGGTIASAALGTCGTAVITVGATCAATTYPVALSGTSEIVSVSSLILKGIAADTTTAPITASSTVGSGSFTFTPAVAGAYVMTVWQDSNVDGIVNASEATNTISITVSATPVASAGASTIFTDSDGTYTGAPDLASTAANKIFHTKTPTTQAAGMRITINNTSGTSVFLTGGTFVAEQSGSGLVACTDTEGTFTEGTTKTRYASLTSLANNIVACALWSDGTAGKGTTTYKWIDAAGVSTTLGTTSSVFYGAVAKIVAKQNHTIAKSTTGTLGIGTAAPSGADVENTPAVTLTITDADGNLVSDIGAGTITAVTSNSSVMTSTISYAESSGAGAGDGFAGNGNYNVRVNSSTNTSGSTATLTFRALGADGVTYVTSSPLTYTLGGAPASSVLTLDKTSYAVGQEAVATITVKDSAGNAVYDTDHAGYFAAATGLTSTLALVKTLYGATALSTLGGKAVSKFNAPSVSGTMTITGTALDKPSALSASATITDGNAAIASSIASLNAKIVALNALIAKIMKRLNIK
jgi:hypothetical protein